MKRVLILEVRRNSVCCFEDDFDVAKRQDVFKGFDQIVPHTERSCSPERQYQRHFHLWHLPLIRFVEEIQNAFINEVWWIAVFPKNVLQFFDLLVHTDQ